MSGRWARLNIFQKTQRLWDTFHPYNAAQAMELVGDFSQQHVANAFNHALADLGLGEFICEGSSYSIDRRHASVHLLYPTDGFEALMDREMNRPFDSRRSMPFRPFDLVDNDRRLIGLTYQHWVADSVSIRMLMRQWLDRIVGRGKPAPVSLPTGGLLQTFGPAVSGWSTIAQTASLFGFASRMKRMRRVDEKSDTTNRVLLRAGPDGLADAVRRRARTTGNTVGDVFLAAAAEACRDFGPNHATARRPDMCMGTIVDLRARGGGRAAGVFGLYLGFTMTAFRGSDVSTFDGLLRRVAAERRTGLARKSAEASQLNMAVGYAIGLARGTTKLREFYRKRFPLAGGLSSVNMTPGWAGENHPSPLAAYHRVSPTGPMLPLVMTPTTLGNRLRLCCTYRSALLSEKQASELVTAFLNRLGHYAG